jgi:HEAT repeat protein
MKGFRFLLKSRTGKPSVSELRESQDIVGLTRAVQHGPARDDAAEALLDLLGDRLSSQVLAVAAGLDSPTSATKRAAFAQLTELRAPALTALYAEAGEDPDREIRSMALDALAGIDTAEARDVLASVLTDVEFDIRWRAAQLLASRRDPRSVGLVVEVLHDTEWAIDEDDGQHWDDGGDDLRREALEARSSLGPVAIPRLVELLAERETGGRGSGPANSLAPTAARWLGAFGARAVPALEVALDEDPQKKIAAAWALGQTGDSEAFEPLARLSRDPSSDVRIAALRSLADLGDRRAAEILAAALRDEDVDVRSAAAFSLGELGDVEAVDLLVPRLDDPSENVRSSAVYALEAPGDPRAVPRLARFLGDRSTSNSAYAATRALARLGTPGADALIAGSQSDDPITRKQALWAMKDMPPRDVRFAEAALSALQDPDAEVRVAALDVVRHSPRGVTAERLYPLLFDENPGVRTTAVEANWAYKRTKTVDRLIELLVGDENAEVRAAAAYGLGLTCEPRARRALEGALSDPDGNVREKAGESLSRYEPELTAHR